MSCIDKLSKQLNQITKSSQEVPQEVMVDTFFKFTKLNQLNTIINKRLGYYQRNSFLKLVIFGFIPISIDQEYFIHNLRYDMNTIHQINPGYFYLVESLDKQDEYIMICLDNNSKYIFYEGVLSKVDNFDNLRYYGEMDGSSRIIRFRYTSDYIQAFRDLEHILRLDELSVCKELIDLVEIFVRTFNLRLNTYAGVSQLIPQLFIETQPIETKFKGTSKKWFELSELDESKFKYNYKNIIDFFDNFTTIKYGHYRRINSSLYGEEEISRIFKVVPSNIPIQEIPDKIRANITLACSILDAGSLDIRDKLEIRKSLNTFREYCLSPESVLFYNKDVYTRKSVLIKMLETFFLTDTLIYMKHIKRDKFLVYMMEREESYNPNDFEVYNVKLSKLCRFEPYLIAYKIAKRDDLVNIYFEYLLKSHVIFRDLEYERLDGDLEFILDFFKFYFDRSESFIILLSKLSGHTPESYPEYAELIQEESYNMSVVYKNSPVSKFVRSRIVSTIVDPYRHLNSAYIYYFQSNLVNEIKSYFESQDLVYSMFMTYLFVLIDNRTNDYINFEVHGELL